MNNRKFTGAVVVQTTRESVVGKKKKSLKTTCCRNIRYLKLKIKNTNFCSHTTAYVFVCITGMLAHPGITCQEISTCCTILWFKIPPFTDVYHQYRNCNLSWRAVIIN